MDRNRPRGREKNVTGHSGSVYKRGSGLGSGPVGGGTGRGSGSGGGGFSSGGGSPQRSGGGGRKSPLAILVMLAVLLFGGGGLGASILGGDGSVPSSGYTSTAPSGLGSLFGGSSGSAYGGWDHGDNTRKLNTSVADGARDKRTQIKGNGADTVTLMVYMCGTDLESRSGMATSDLQEMISANPGKNVNVIVYTGGCSGWKNSAVSSSVNQIYQVQQGGLQRLVKNAGTASMTDPNTLAEFIQFCSKNFPANRRELILWDHGGGSVTGYGYDEKNPRSGSMTLSGVDKALKKAGVTFDFIGFDACLMATVETAIMLDDYADYLIASEETEPGVGWYYTNWLSALSRNPSISTLELGKNIADDFVDVCARKCAGQKTTLSVIDLAEVAATVPDALSAFAQDTTNMLQNNQYKTVSDARNQCREFGKSSVIDQVDLAHLAWKMNTDSGDTLAKTLLSAVKYNRTSSDMTNSYGLSIYFPCKKLSKVDSAVSTYKQIGMDADYTRCIQAFASMEVGGQAVAGGSAASSPIPSLLSSLGSASGSSASSSGGVSSDMITQLLTGLMTGQISGMKGLDTSNTAFLSSKAIESDAMVSFLTDNRFDPANLVWSDDSTPVISMPESQWDLVQELELNVFYDDGAGFIDLGMDNVFDFNDDGDLVGQYDGTWLAINDQPVAYYYENTVDDGENYTITGHVPALLNGVRVNLILVFTNEYPHGYIAGATTDYRGGETDTVAKSLLALEPGDTLDFLCDYYSYSGKYQDSYYLGEQMTVTDNMEISNVSIGENCSATYRFTDIFQQQYWTDVIPQ